VGGAARAVAVPNLTAAARASTPVLWLAAAAQLVLQLDFSIVNVALAPMQQELRFTPASLQWVVTGYALTYGALLLGGGRLGDMIGHRRASLGGLTLFAMSSLVGGLAVTPAMLIASRMVQGSAAALVAPATLALVIERFDNPSARARALGIVQGSTAAGAMAGTTVGGVLTQFLGWRWVLLVNPPIIVVLVVLMARTLPRSLPRDPAARRRSLDLPGAALATTSIAALILGLGEGQQRGFDAPVSWGSLVVAAALAAAFVPTERRGRDPMLPPTLLRDRPRRAALAVIVLVGGIAISNVYFVSLYEQRVLGFSPLMTGLSLVPATVTVMIVSTQVTHRLMLRRGMKQVLVLGVVLVCAGQFWLSHISQHGHYPVDILVGIVINACGLGLTLPAASVAITSNIAPSKRGVASGLFVSAQQIGAAAGLAALATVAASRTAHTGSLTDGYRLSYDIATALGLLAMILVLVVLRGRDDSASPRPRPSKDGTTSA
jgi:MFS family permease